MNENNKLNILPHSNDAEVAVLGSMLSSKEAVSKSIQWLKPDYFYKDAHGIIFSTMSDLFEKGESIDTLSVIELLKQNKTHKLTDKYMNIIRYHSFYPWHSKGEYRQFMNKSDYIKLEDVIMFNQFDLYSKEDKDFVLTDNIKKYYENLLDLYFPKELQW